MNELTQTVLEQLIKLFQEQKITKEEFDSNVEKLKNAELKELNKRTSGIFEQGKQLKYLCESMVELLAMVETTMNAQADVFARIMGGRRSKRYGRIEKGRMDFFNDYNQKMIDLATNPLPEKVKEVDKKTIEILTEFDIIIKQRLKG